MPYSQMHYPFENKKKFEDNFPAEFIAEGVDQARCWFYYLHVLSTALRNKEAFKNVIANGTVLAEDGKKMSKRLKNYPDPKNIFEKYGADATRYYLASSQVVKAEDLRFSEKEVDEVLKKIILILLNVFSFYKMYQVKDSPNTKSNNILDKWIISKTENLKQNITNGYKKYDLNQAVRPIGQFINNLSTWYLRRSRDRFKNKTQQKPAAQTLKYVFLELSKVMAPIMPFNADYIYKEVASQKESVHLADWPEVNEKLINHELEEKMEQARDICSIALQKRAEAGIKVRQPLNKLKIKSQKLKTEFADLIKQEVNIKQIIFDSKLKEKIELDTEITPELKEEGMVRDFIRKVQSKRKKGNLTPKDKINVSFGNQEFKNAVLKNKKQVKKQVIAQDIEFKKELDNIEIIKI